MLLSPCIAQPVAGSWETAAAKGMEVTGEGHKELAGNGRFKHATEDIEETLVIQFNLPKVRDPNSWVKLFVLAVESRLQS